MYAQLLGLISWLNPLSQEALRKVLADPTFPNGPQDSVSESSSGLQSVLSTLFDNYRALRLLFVHLPKYGEYDTIEGSLGVDSLDNSSLYTALSLPRLKGIILLGMKRAFGARPNESSAIKIN